MCIAYDGNKAKAEFQQCPVSVSCHLLCLSTSFIIKRIFWVQSWNSKYFVLHPCHLKTFNVVGQTFIWMCNKPESSSTSFLQLVFLGSGEHGLVHYLYSSDPWGQHLLHSWTEQTQIERSKSTFYKPARAAFLKVHTTCGTLTSTQRNHQIWSNQIKQNENWTFHMLNICKILESLCTKRDVFFSFNYLSVNILALIWHWCQQSYHCLTVTYNRWLCRLCW